MLIEEKKIQVASHEQKPTTFVIERFKIPEGLVGVQVYIKLIKGDISCAFIYDSNYTLRAEIDEISQEKRIVIHEETIKSSACAEPGPIPGGEWIIALEVNLSLKKENWEMMYTVVGMEKA